MPNLIATLYDGTLDLTFECCSEERCKHALCEVMPPDGNAPCFCRQHGECISRFARQETVTKLRDRLTALLRECAEEEGQP